MKAPTEDQNQAGSLVADLLDFQNPRDHSELFSRELEYVAEYLYCRLHWFQHGLDETRGRELVRQAFAEARRKHADFDEHRDGMKLALLSMRGITFLESTAVEFVEELYCLAKSGGTAAGEQPRRPQ